MAQGDYLIQNQSFPSFRSDLNSTLEAINTSNSGTSRPTSAVAGTIWLDTTNATSPTLKFYDGADDISLATLDYTANTVNWLDSTVSVNIVSDTTPQLGGDLDVNGNSIVSVANGNITFTPDGTGKVIIDGLSYPTADGTANQVLTTDGAGNLSFADASGGGATWQSVKTASFTAVAGEGYFCNTTSSAFTVTLPASPSAGDFIQVVDYAGTFDTNTLTINPNSNKINGGTDNLILTGEREGATLTYVDATQGWIATSGINEGTEALSPNAYSADILVVAGGGGSGNAQTSPQYATGGGGAGGFRTSTTDLGIGTVFTVTVGGGGAIATAGSDSSISGSGFTTITSAGGGQGGQTNGSDGGSGGGGGGNGPNTKGSGNVPATTPAQGNDGGDGSSASNTSGGGGGGAGQAGFNGTTDNGADGGDGSQSSITGTATYYAGGGGGGAGWTGASGSGDGTGGLGGGGNGSTGTGGQDGTANTGGGGGGGRGAEADNGALGGSGVVIIRVATADYSGTTTGSPTVTTDGTDTVIKFTSSGSYTG